MLKKIILFFFVIVELFSQTEISISNYFKYGNGFENFGEGGFVDRKQKKYFDEYLDSKIYFPNYTIGFRLEKSNPPEFGLPFEGVRKKYIQYQNDNYTIRFGDLYALYGNGLSLNLFENRAISYDSGILGLNSKYENEKFTIQLTGGKIKFLVPSTLYENNVRFENYFLKSGMTKYKIQNSVIGISYVYADAIFPSIYDFEKKDSFTVKLPELFYNYQKNNFEFNASYNLKITNEFGNKNQGSGFYSSLSYSKNNFGFTLDYKDYRYSIVDPEKKTEIFRKTRMLPFQNPPTVHKEHTFNLLNRYPYVVDFNDEVGIQFDLFFLFDENTTLNFNTSLSSEHYEFQYNPEESNFKKIINNSIFIPSFKNERSPFWEIYFEIEHYYNSKLGSYFKTAINRRSETIYDPIFIFAKVQPINSFSVPFEVQHILNSMYSLKFSTEHQWVKKYPLEKFYYNHLLMLQFSKSPDFSISFRWETTTSDLEPRGEKNWGVVEVAYQPNKNNNLILSYGSERGGQICSSGICRQVNPFSGLRFSLITSI